MWMHGIVWAGLLLGGILWLRKRKKKTGLLLAVIGIGNLCGSILTWQGGLGRAVSEEGLLRMQQTEGYYTQELILSREGTADERVTLEIPPKSYSRQEKQKILQDAKKKLDEIILGENEDFGHIDSPLVFPEELEASPVMLEWYSSRPELLDWEGNLQKMPDEEGELVTVTAVLIFQDEELEYQREVRVYPRELSEMERMLAGLQKKLEEENRENSGELVRLPKSWNETAIHWEYPPDTTGYSILFLTVLAAFLIFGVQKGNENKELEEKAEEMLRDYPDVVSKITLFLQAGMSMRQIFMKIAQEYEKEKKKEKRWAYEEIVETYRELQRGVSEDKAYEDFGKRCLHPAYKTLAVLLVQNLKKGSRDLILTLQRESVEAFENRKREAKAAGEKAGTKLLFPMILMLIVVLVILIVPAFCSFR